MPKLMRMSKEERQKARDLKNQEEMQRRQEKLDNKYKESQQTYKFRSMLEKLKFETYTKRLVGIIVAIGLIDLQLSYVLAFLDKIEIAEDLSTQVCTTILGTALIYMIRAYFDTKAEKNDEKSTINKDAEDRILEQVRTTLYDAGVSIPSNVEDLVPKFSSSSSSSETKSTESVSVPIPVPEEDDTSETDESIVGDSGEDCVG